MNLHAYIKLVEDRAFVAEPSVDAGDDDVIRLYHGTNDVMAQEIERYGFQSPSGPDAYAVFRDLAQRVVHGELSRETVRALRNHATFYRTPAIFFTPLLHIAQEHAQANAKTGGELGGEIQVILKDVLGLHGNLFEHAHPVVITVDLPRSWIEGDVKPTQYEVIVHRDEIDPVYIVGVDKV